MRHLGAAHPRLFAVYAVVSIAAAAVALWLSARPGPPGSLAPTAVVLAAMIAVEATSRARAETPSGRAFLDAVGLLILGPIPTAWLVPAGMIVGRGWIGRRASWRMAAEAPGAALAILAAGAVWVPAGGRAASWSARVPLLALVALTYLLCRGLAGAVERGLWDGPDPWRAGPTAVRQALVETSCFFVLGAAAGTAILVLGPGALLLFVPSWLVLRIGLWRWMDARRDLKDFVRALGEVLDEIDPYTRQHSARVAGYAVRLARALGLSERRIEDLEYAALAHDLGKIAPQHQHILNKHGALSIEEQRTMRGHPAVGAGILGKIRALRRSAEIVRLHHERPDGRGYPFGLRSDRTPLGARILNVADAFDAMTCDRPYRRALDVEAAVSELERGAGTQFDREVVECLTALVRSGRFPLIPGPSTEELLLLRTRAPRVRA